MTARYASARNGVVPPLPIAMDARGHGLTTYVGRRETLPVLGDAREFAGETMRCSRANVETIVGRLTDIGFPFGNRSFDAGPIVARPLETAGMLNEPAEKDGLLPLSVRVWWRMVGAVDLRGPRPPIWSFDPLVVYPLEQQLEAFEEWEDACAYDGIDMVRAPRLLREADEKVDSCRGTSFLACLIHVNLIA